MFSGIDVQFVFVVFFPVADGEVAQWCGLARDYVGEGLHAAKVGVNV